MMLQQIFTYLPTIALLMGMAHLVLLYMNGTQTAKTYASTARIWLLAAILCQIVINEQNISTAYFVHNAYNLLFILWVGISIYIILLLSGSWFVSSQRTGCRYSILLLCAYICLNIILGTRHIGILMSGYIALTVVNYALFKINYEKQFVESSKRYLIISICIIFLGALSGVYLYIEGAKQFNYSDIAAVFSQNGINLVAFLAAMGIFVPVLYALNVAPFHIMAEEKQSRSILPVAHYFALIPMIAFFAILLKLNQLFYPIYGNHLTSAYKILALLSIIFGAIGANARINLHRICAYSTIFHIGIVLLLISLATPEAIETAFIYLFIYLTALGELYTVCYNLRSHGEYLSSISSLAGMAENRPYATGALLVSLFSMMGLPPLSGFLGQLNVVYELLHQESYLTLLTTMICILLIIRAYLGVIMTVYFEKKTKSFDAENKYVLMCTMLYVLAIIGLTFNPFHIFEHIKDMFNVILL